MRSRFDVVARARNADILETAMRAGATLKRVTSAEWAGPCPTCGGTDRFAVNTKRRLFNCRGFGGGDVIAMTRHALDLGFTDAVEFITGGDACEATRRNLPALKAVTTGGETTTAGALAIWGASVDPGGTLAERYLARRRLIVGRDVAGAVLRWSPRIGAMIALFRNIMTGEPQSVARTFLDPDGHKLRRWFVGPTGGAAVMLDGFEVVTNGLHIGEGVETCLAARQLGLRPTWALGSVGAISSFPVLGGIECLTILAEHDASSAEAVQVCGERWHAAGREVLLNRAIRGKDLNDALKGTP